MSDRVTILFGTVTGNAEDCAHDLGDALRAKGLATEVVDMEDYDSGSLASEDIVFLITSTYGDGDPPGNAIDLKEWLDSDDAPRLEGLRFGVCGLGDSVYPNFCQCGKDFDARFEALGAKRIVDRQDCDADFEVFFEEWKDEVAALFEGSAPAAPAPEPEPVKKGGWGFMKKVGALFGGSKPDPAPASPAPKTPAPAAPAPGPVAYSKDAPFPATITSSRLLSGPGSTKETRHYELDISEGGFDFHPGDSFGVMPQNCPGEVTELLEAAALRPETAVKFNGEDSTLFDVLLDHKDLAHVGLELTRLYGEQEAGAAASMLAGGDKQALSDWMADRFVIDLVAEHAGFKVDPQRLVKALRALRPRLYSVANSAAVDPSTVHFTVETLRYESGGRARKGVASCWLADRVTGDTAVPLYLEANTHFRVPADPTAKTIMVGPGTGIAPFRGFLQERVAKGATGDNWLFFGHRNERTDHLYGDELNAWIADGKLRVTYAWSRDQAAKMYVQDRMLEHKAELWAWLSEGAHLYVCGDAVGMAPGVDAALREIATACGGHTPESAAAWLEGLKRDNRYARDVY